MLTLVQTAAEMVSTLVATIAPVSAPRFANVTYRNEKGELAKHSLLLGVKMERVYERDLALVKHYLTRANLTPLQVLAATEIRDSLQQSLDKGIGNNDKYVHGPLAADTYVHLLPGIKINKSDNPEDRGTVYVTGYSNGKVVLEPGVYPVVKSREKTIVKNAIKRELHMRTDRIRQLKLKMCSRAALEGKVLVFIQAE